MGEKFARFEDFATVEAFPVLRVVIFSDQTFAFVFAERIGHEVLSKKAARSIASATYGSGVACGDWFGPQAT